MKKVFFKKTNTYITERKLGILPGKLNFTHTKRKNF